MSNALFVRPNRPDLHATADETDLSGAIRRAAAPLLPCDRAAFLRDVMSALQGRQPGSGPLHRIIVEVQRRYRDLPLEA